jgi:hypothetical protein
MCLHRCLRCGSPIICAGTCSRPCVFLHYFFFVHQNVDTQSSRLSHLVLFSYALIMFLCTRSYLSLVKVNWAAFYGTKLYVTLSLHHRFLANITSQVLLFLPWLVSDIATSLSSTLAVHSTALCLGEGDLMPHRYMQHCSNCILLCFIRPAQAQVQLAVD